MKTRIVSVDEAPIPDSEVARQLQRLLESDVFKNSKRCRTFLSYVVQQRLAGHTDNLREKVIGVEAFSRPGGYDTTEDPVVRITAGEVRKRLAQYYHDPAHLDDLKVEILAGSYIPEFHFPARPTAPPQQPLLSPEAETPQAGDVSPVPSGGSAQRMFLAVALPILLAAGGYALWRSGTVGSSPPFERFWEPTLSAHGPVLISVGQSRVYSLRKEVANAAEADLDPTHSGIPARSLAKGFAITSRDILPSWDRYVPLGDAISMTATAVFLHSRHREYRLRSSGNTTLADLREGTAILFGAFSNDWTLRINKDLRFRVIVGPEGFLYVRDSNDPGFRKWQIGAPLDVEYTDYAVLTRVFDRTTGHPVMSVGGITHLGTRAGGEFLLSEEKLNEALHSAPAGWEKRNLQMVISTRVIGASASPPQFLALHSW